MTINDQTTTAESLLACVIAATLRRENPNITHEEIIEKSRKIVSQEKLTKNTPCQP